jgi:hypothetical protein
MYVKLYADYFENWREQESKPINVKMYIKQMEM